MFNQEKAQLSLLYGILGGYYDTDSTLNFNEMYPRTTTTPIRGRLNVSRETS